MRCARICPCNANALKMGNDASNLDDVEDDVYYPTPMYKVAKASLPKMWDPKVTMDGNYFTYFFPLTFDAKQFCQGHPQVYTDEKIQQFDANFQKQLLFNFCAMHASRNKSASINDACTSHLCNIELKVMPTSFSHETTDWHKIIHYVLENVLTCPVGCCVIVCICAGANGDPTKLSYLDQAKRISDRRK